MVGNLRANLVTVLVGAALLAAACGDDSKAGDAGVRDGGGDSGADAQTGPVCGNGILEPGEQCDDGNLKNTDSCSSLCRIITPTETSCSADKIVDLAVMGKVTGLTTSFSGNVGNGTNDLEPPMGCQDSNGGHGTEIVHKFHLPVKADLIASTDNPASQLDSVIYFLTACTPGTAPMTAACNDDADPNNMDYNSLVGLSAAAPGDYYIVVDGYNATASTTANGAYRLDVTVRPVLAAAAACDPAGALNRCDAGLTCKTSGGAATCATGAAPVLTTLHAFDLGMSQLRVTMDGSDADGDTTQFVAEFLDSTGTPMMLGGTTSFVFGFGQPVTGQTTFSTFANIDATPLTTPPTSIRVKLRDGAGLESAKLTSTLVPLPTVASAGSCDPAGIANTCTATTDLCKPTAPGATTGTCTAGAAPTLTAARAYNLTSGAKRVVVDGGDADGDITSGVLTFLDASNNVVMVDADGAGAASPSVLGFSLAAGTLSFHGSIDLAANVFTGVTPITQVKVKLRDATNQDSPELTVPFIAFPEVTSSCDPSRTDNECAVAAVDASVVPANVCETNMTCTTLPLSRAAACAAAASLTLGTPVTGVLPFGPDRWQGPATCQGTASSGGSEAVYKLTTTQTTDLHFSTDFPETTIDSVVYLASGCGDTLTVLGCSDDVAFPSNVHSDGYAQDVPAGDHFVFVDSWTTGVTNGGSGPYKLEVSERPILSSPGAACDPLVIANRCGGTLTCQPNATLSAFTCK